LPITPDAALEFIILDRQAKSVNAKGVMATAQFRT